MDNNKIQLNDSQLKKYRQALYNFEKYIEVIYSKNNLNQEHRGFLIKYKDFEEFKNTIEYNNYKNYDLNIKKENIHFYNSEKVFKIKQIEFKTSKFFLNMLYNDNKYIIINYELWLVICEIGRENESPIIYNIDSKYIKLVFEDGKQLNFTYHQFDKNIIDKYSYSYYNYNNNLLDEFKKIYKDINMYYKFEKDFIEKLKDNYYSSYNSAYLVCKTWIDKWKIYSNYEEIKNNYLDQNLS